MAQFKMSFPSPEVTVEADSESEAWWVLARYFGMKSDGHAADDPEFAYLGVDHSSATIECLNPETLPQQPEPAPTEEA